MLKNTQSVFLSDHTNLAIELAKRTKNKKILDELSGSCIFSKGKPIPFSIPFEVNSIITDHLAELSLKYHRMIENIALHYSSDPLLKERISIPHQLRHDVNQTPPFLSRVHFCRLDFYFDNYAHPYILETNANCPGLLIYAGIVASTWRQIIGDIKLPSSRSYEDPSWFSKWYIEIVENLTGKLPNEVALFRQEGGHRLELDEIAHSFSLFNIPTFECDPRDLTLTNNDHVEYRGHRINFGYSKISIPEMCEMRSKLDPFFRALTTGNLFIPNGTSGRFIGDNKLCLAIISDESFSYLFNSADLEFVRPHIPWSRNISFCNNQELKDIMSHKNDYVLKRPLDTRGRGIIIGKEMEETSTWLNAVHNGIENNWLVMQYIEPSTIDIGFGNERHDLALGLTEGNIIGGFSRSSTGFRVNVAQCGKLHPLFF